VDADEVDTTMDVNESGSAHVVGDPSQLTALASAEGVTFDLAPGRAVVAVQGLGFVGAAMCVAAATAVDAAGDPCFNVVGVDLGDDAGRRRIDSLNSGRFPFETTDTALVSALSAARERANLFACADPAAYGLADVVVVDIPLDIDWRSEQPALRLAGFEAAIRTVGRHVHNMGIKAASWSYFAELAVVVCLVPPDRLIITNVFSDHRTDADVVRRQIDAERWKRLAQLADVPSLEKCIGDLRDRKSLDAAVKGCSALYHVAADYRFDVADPEDVYKSNVEGTRGLLEAATPPNAGGITA
jgi:hypothetical protein